MVISLIYTTSIFLHGSRSNLLIANLNGLAILVYKSRGVNMSFIARCPFCDSLNIRRGSFQKGLYARYYYVQCLACWAIGPKTTSDTDALDKWNKRVCK